MNSSENENCITLPLVDEECIKEVVFQYLSGDKKVKTWIEQLAGENKLRIASLYKDLTLNDTHKTVDTVLRTLEFISLMHAESDEQREEIREVYSKLRETIPLWIR